MLSRIDDWLVNRMQRVTNRFQRLTGLTKFWLEKWCLILCGLCFAFDAVASKSLVLTGLAAIVWLIVGLVRWLEEKDRRASRGDIHPPLLRKNERMGLVVLYGVGVLLPPIDFASMGLAAMIVSVYLDACLPLPPARSAIRKWYEKALEWLQPSPQPVTFPSR